MLFYEVEQKSKKLGRLFANRFVKPHTRLSAEGRMLHNT